MGVPAEKADLFYQEALDAAEELFKDYPSYPLYDRKEDRSENFSYIFLDKSNNPEVIFVRDYIQSETWDGDQIFEHCIINLGQLQKIWKEVD